VSCLGHSHGNNQPNKQTNKQTHGILLWQALDRLASSLGDRESTYEGHERLKTAYYRARSKKALDDGYDICAYGALVHFKKGDYQCGLELATMMLDAYGDDLTEYSGHAKQRVMLLIGQYPKGGSVSCVQEEQLVSGMQQMKHRTIMWLNKIKSTPAVEEMKKMVYLKSGLYASDVLGWEGVGVALPDMIRAGDVDRLYDDVLVKSLSRMSAFEQDLLVGRTMLHILEYLPVARKEEACAMAIQLYTRCGTHDRHSIATCVYYIVLALQRNSEDLAKASVQVLAECEGCARDPSILELCRRDIMPKYSPRNTAGSDPLSSLMQGLFQSSG